jgi:hypothetical protein
VTSTVRHDEPRPTATWLGASGLGLTALGIIGYFAVALRLGAWLPTVRNDAIPNWILIGLGLVLSTMALIRARRRVLAGILFGLNVALAAAFTFILYVFSAMPAVAGPPIGAPAPAFALVDQSGKTVSLDDFRGAPLLLVFYRGHW